MMYNPRYISEWENEARGITSNIRVTTKVAVHALLDKELRDIGSAVVFNMLAKEVKTAVSRTLQTLPSSYQAFATLFISTAAGKSC
jgi:hypothetical protein